MDAGAACRPGALQGARVHSHCVHAPLTLIVHCHLWVSSSASTCGQLLPVAEAMEYVWRGMQALSAVGFEPTRSYLQWVLSPPP